MIAFVQLTDLETREHRSIRADSIVSWHPHDRYLATVVQYAVGQEARTVKVRESPQEVEDLLLRAMNPDLADL